MMPPAWTTDQIAALIDGALPAPEAEVVRRAIEADREARAEAERIRRLNLLLRAAYDTPADAPMPAPVAAALYGEDGKVKNMSEHRRARLWIPAAAAAVLVLAVGLALNGTFDDPSNHLAVAVGETPADSDLHLALEKMPSGRTSPEGVQPMLTFRDQAGRPCREFEVAGQRQRALTLGIACRTDGGRWQVQAVVPVLGSEPTRNGYTPAAGAVPDTLEAVLDALGAGAALTPEEEASLLRNGWDE